LKKILIVDDEKNILLVLKIALKKAGYETILAKDGLEAIEKAREQKPDLILLDIVLPKLNGYLVYEALQEEPKTAKIPVVFISAKSEKEDIDKALDLGGEDYLTKPLEKEKLLQTINEILERR